jgi:hypothetical protein
MAYLEISDIETRYDYSVNVQQYEYIHFQEITQQENYLLNNKHLKISHLCCGGKGIAFENKNYIKTSAKQVSRLVGINGTCDICFLDDVELLKACDTCSQPFCRSCLEKVGTKVCPYCRGKLRNNL